ACLKSLYGNQGVNWNHRWTGGKKVPLREMNREQMWLLPPALEELIPTDHPARFVVEFVDALDREGWAELEVQIDGDPMGAPAYHPHALLSVWLYGFMTGVRSCRRS
ncbi:MAG: hypothetical protein J4G14_14090, partial [Dehalococcoidia bacterium]|nr:hypothetical protein [Dehalococcoidia bacterium]